MTTTTDAGEEFIACFDRDELAVEIQDALAGEADAAAAERAVEAVFAHMFRKFETAERVQ